MDEYPPLTLLPTPAAPLALVQAEQHVALTDPASSVFTDLRVAPAVVVPATEALSDTRRLMQLAGVRMAFVVDPAERVIGMVTLADLQGEQPAQVARVRGVAPTEVVVHDVMAAVSQWVTLDVGELARAQVGHVMASFAACGRRYLVVTEKRIDDAQLGRSHRVIRGVFSANRVERALGRPIEPQLRSTTFAELAANLG